MFEGYPSFTWVLLGTEASISVSYGRHLLLCISLFNSCELLYISMLTSVWQAGIYISMRSALTNHSVGLHTCICGSIHDAD